MKHVGVILSGCGVYDGSEIHEAVLTLLSLARSGANVSCIAPDITQKHVVDHAKAETMIDEDRNVMQEAARISRGNIIPLDQVQVDQFDAYIYVGGYGAAKNLSSFAFDGAAYDVDPSTVSLIQEAHAAGKPQGFMCIAPVLAARALGHHHVQVTVGNDTNVALALEEKGATHIDCSVGDIVVDFDNKVVSTPAYMLAENILQAENSINQLVKAVLQIA